MDIKVFNYHSNEVRTLIDRNGESWWVAKDVCDVLGMTNSREAISNLDDDEKNTVRISDGIQAGNPNVNVINEPGLYTLIIRSNKPEAKPFKRWITHEVLPSIRKTGSYSMHGGYVMKGPIHKDAAAVVESWLHIGQKLGTSVQMSRVVAVRKANDETSIDFSPLLTDNTVPEKPLTPTALAGLHGVTAKAMNAMLEKEGFQKRSGKMWLATEKGRSFSTLDPYQAKNSNHTGYRLLWNATVLSALGKGEHHVPS